MRKVHKAQLAEMASKVLWGSLVQPALWVLLEKMEIRYGEAGVHVVRQAVSAGSVLNSIMYDTDRGLSWQSSAVPLQTWREGMLLK